jgi:hypothetical protein
MAHRFVGLREDGGKIHLVEEDRTTIVRQVLWGDFLKVDREEPDGFLRIDWAPNSDNPQKLFIHKDDTVETRPLEVIFVDVGQGDGAVLITPERDAHERILVIDAGERGNMRQFLDDRFKTSHGFDFEAAVITHPDKDHYLGFEEVFRDHRIGFKKVYQNGLVERPVAGSFEKVGGTHPDPVTGVEYAENLAEDRATLQTHFSNSAQFGRMAFPPVMHAALQNPKIDHFEMLSTKHGTIDTGRARFPRKGSDESRAMIDAAAPSFRSHIMKTCHHGSEKVTDEFLQTVNPACFIISSGDAEGHVHPRPDLLGRLGRFGRGASPVLLSTELQRSTREIEDPERIAALHRLIERLAANPTEARKQDVIARVDQLARTNVEVYGSIYLKTDGRRLITAFRIETDSLKDRWFYFEYVLRANGELELVSH